MYHDEPSSLGLADEAVSTTFLEDVTSGLNRRPKTLPCKYFYDERGSQLFDQICELDEYYLTRTELEIMRRFAPDMVAVLGTGVILIELGSGSSVKTRLLLNHLADPVAYVPVDISREHLHKSSRKLAAAYAHLEVIPVCADFTGSFSVPQPKRKPARSVVYLPGSTIGNFETEAAIALMGRIARLCGPGGGLLIGIDLQKDVETIETAYNDDQGVTAEFNLNLLQRINYELEGDFVLDQFRHEADYDEVMGRVEISLISKQRQVVNVGDESFCFDKGEGIRTEYSHKYAIDQFASMAVAAGLALRRDWTDDKDLFAVLYLEVTP